MNGPLQGIRSAAGRLNYLIDRGANLNQIERQAREIDTFAGEAGEIVDRFTMISRRQDAFLSQRDEYRFKQSTVVAIIRRAGYPFRRLAEEREIRIHNHGRLFELPPIECDPEKLRTLFANLIENGVKFSHAKREVTIEGRADDDSIVISVKDYGLGIPEEDLQANIFKPFYESSVADPTRVIGGTGLGLTICKEIAERHHGSLIASCEIPAGKRMRHGLTLEELMQGCWVEFTLSLPIRQPEEEN